MKPAGARVILTTHVPWPGSAFVEWLAWHRLLGVTELRVCTPRRGASTHPLLVALAEAGLLRILPADADPELGQEPHNAALRAGASELGESGGWGLFLLPDEYLSLDDAVPDIPALMRGVDVLTVPLCEAGPGGQLRHAPGPMLKTPRPVAAPGPEGPLRSVVRLGLFAARTPEMPVGPTAGGAPLIWLDGSGAPLPAPASRVAWARAGHCPGGARARVLRIAAPSEEGYRLRVGQLPAGQQPDEAAVSARLAALAAIDGPPQGLGARADALDAGLAEIMACPGVAEAQAALEAEERAACAPPVPVPGAEAKEPPTPGEAAGDPAADTAPAPALPGWFAEIHTSGDRQGSYARLDNHAVLHIRRDPARLVVTFDNLANVNDTSPAREPWAYRFVRESGASHLAVMAQRKDWYRCPELIAHLQGLADAGVFSEPDRVWLTGTSMGGFGALAFASLAPGATVVAFSPQTTLDETLVPWEGRFAMGRARNWSLPHSDAAFEIDEAAQVFVLYDPFFAPDRRHVERLEGETVIPLRTWCSGHFSPVFLRRAGLLKPVMQHALDGTLTPAVFYGLYRARRRLPWYRKALQTNLQERGHESLARRVRPAFRRLIREAAE